ISAKLEDGKKWLTDSWNEVSWWFVDKVWRGIYKTGVGIIKFVVGVFCYGWDGIEGLWKIVWSWLMDNVWNGLVEGVTDVG
ncbi:hypothetical protein, partial [Bacillus subtilis]|uniref:hypothetical protein n=1 Tax=Bacillus subtilis TaxID=1423 RepID=UPI001BDB9733